MSTATDMLALYITAETAVLAGQAFTVNGHSYTYADLDKIRAGRAEWQKAVNAETANASKSGSGFCSFANFAD